MNTSLIQENPLHSAVVENQLQKICNYPVLQGSPLLKKFLIYIVHETLAGRAVYLKEYTIAIKALDKPVNFNPQQSCVVRIHARRLRSVLQLYYQEKDRLEEIIISIPKGKYVPIFEAINLTTEHTGNRIIVGLPYSKIALTSRLAIYPFSCSPQDSHLKEFTDSICFQLSTALVNAVPLSIAAYQVTKSILHNNSSMSKFAAEMKCRYVVTGSLQLAGQLARMIVSILDSIDNALLWSNTFEFDFVPQDSFALQDLFCDEVIKAVNKDHLPGSTGATFVNGISPAKAIFG